jgi:hypothetical protein
MADQRNAIVVASGTLKPVSHIGMVLRHRSSRERPLDGDAHATRSIGRPNSSTAHYARHTHREQASNPRSEALPHALATPSRRLPPLICLIFPVLRVVASELSIQSSESSFPIFSNQQLSLGLKQCFPGKDFDGTDEVPYGFFFPNPLHRETS